MDHPTFKGTLVQVLELITGLEPDEKYIYRLEGDTVRKIVFTAKIDGYDFEITPDNIDLELIGLGFVVSAQLTISRQYLIYLRAVLSANKERIRYLRELHRAND